MLLHARAWLIAVLVALALALSSAVAGAQARPPIIVGAEGPSAIRDRLVAELQVLGFAVVEPEAGSDDADLARLADAEGARAFVRVDAEAVEIWILDRAARRARLRELVPAEGGGDADDITIAVRAAEIVRAAALSNEPAETRRRRPRDVETEIALDLRSEPSPVWPRFTAEVGMAGMLSPGGVPLAPAMLATVRWMPGGRFGVTALAAAQLATSIDAQAGTVNVGVVLAGIGLHVEGGAPADALRPSADIGLAAASFRSEGVAASGFVGASNDVLVALPFVRAGLSRLVAGPVRARAGLLAGVAAPTPLVRVEGVEVARWGRPVFAGSIGIELVWP